MTHQSGIEISPSIWVGLEPHDSHLVSHRTAHYFCFINFVKLTLILTWQKLRLCSHVFFAVSQKAGMPLLTSCTYLFMRCAASSPPPTISSSSADSSSDVTSPAFSTVPIAISTKKIKDHVTQLHATLFLSAGFRCPRSQAKHNRKISLLTVFEILLQGDFSRFYDQKLSAQ